MKKIVLFFVLCLFFLGCQDRKVRDYGEKVVFTKQCDTSAVWRVKTHSFGFVADRGVGWIAIILENGKKFSIKYHSEDVTKDWMFLNKGDTVVYQGDKVVSVIWKR